MVMKTQTKIGRYVILPSLLVGLIINQLVNDPNYLLDVRSYNYTDLISSVGLLFLESFLAFILLFSLCQGIMWAWANQGGKRVAGVGLALASFILMVFAALIVWNASVCYTCP